MRTLIVTFVGLSMVSAVVGQPYSQWGELEPGPYKVGFQVEQVYDYSRTFRMPVDFSGVRAPEPVYRPVQISIWYPASNDGEGLPVRYKEYLYLWRTEQDFAPLTEAQREATLREFRGRSAWRQYLNTPLTDGEWQQVLDTPTAALRDAQPAPGAFPLVLHINATYFHNVDVEYLASHGYVIASVRNVGVDPASTRFCCNDPQDIEAYTEDLAFVHQHMRRFSFVDPKNVAFAGPTASTAGLGFQMRNGNLKAIVGWEFEPAASVEALPFYDVAKVRLPILAMNSEERATGQDGLVSYHYADRYAVQFEGLRHADVYALFHKLWPERVADRRHPSRLINGYDAMTRYTHRFLAAFVKGDEEHLAWVDQFAQEDGTDQKRSYLPGDLTPPLEYEFTALLEQDVAQAESLYWAVAVRDPNRRLFEDHRLRRIGRQHLRAGRHDEALAVYKMIAHSYPDSPEAQHDLGMAYASANQTEEAKHHLQQAWARDPTNLAFRDRYMQVAALGPSGRNQPTLTFDAARQQGVLFGGFGSDGALNDTWLWDGTAWHQRVVDNAPPARGSHAAAFDLANEKVIVFGGVGGGVRFGDTWLWDGDHWTQAASLGPPARSSHQMTYDASRNQVLLFGGNSDDGLLGDTWLWDGATWMQQHVLGPSPRKQHQMVYDAAHQRIVLFGGSDAQGYQGDTWVWEGAQWTLIAETGPPARDHHGLGYDAKHETVVLFGGWNGTYLGDTWTLNGQMWVPDTSSGPSPRGGKPAMVSWGNQGLIVYGGGNAEGMLRDLWRRHDGHWSLVYPSHP